MEDTSWVRTLYLYFMCVVSIALLAVGAVGLVSGLVHTIAPDLGHRDTIDRVGIGLSNVGKEIVEIVEERSADDAREYCADAGADFYDSFDECMDDNGGTADLGPVVDGVGEVKSELQSQIRKNSIDTMIRGLLAVAIGLLLFRVHARRTAVFANGLFPVRPAAAADEPPADAPALDTAPGPQT
jgi:hypothetical protein